uniref:F-box domain-containing protein n=1 Tax=Lepeophtheirus salmonis TaxID=72036 RepID=A0A0K2UHQ8_LEPSM
MKSMEMSLIRPSDASKAIFSVPHARMKELVDLNLCKLENLRDFTSGDVGGILQRIYVSMWELKSHEYIEDTYILNRLKDRLQARRVYNKVVCNCHEDSKLLNVIDLVEKLYYARNIALRQELGARLQLALHDFLEEFIHHMSEEEKVFQPLLNKYFDQKELENLLNTVLEQHRLWKEKVSAEKSLKLVKRKRKFDEDEYIAEIASAKMDHLRFRRSYCEEVNDFFGKRFTSAAVLRFEDLPNEIVIRIFGYLSPYHLISSCSRVSRKWNRLCVTPNIWRNLYPVMWARGHWSFHFDETLIESCIDDDKQYNFFDSDDDDDINNPIIKNDNGVNKEDKEAVFLGKMALYLLPKIGTGVRRLVLSGTRSLSSSTARSFLMKLPDLQHLKLSYCPNIDDDAFKGLRRYAALRQLRTLDLSGCKRLTDRTFERISSCYFPVRRARKMSQLRKISLSGVHNITNDGLDQLQLHAKTLEFVDLSGCFRLSGTHLNAFISHCSQLKPENLYYCNMISNGPFPNSANGCQNLDCPLRNCCQLSTIRY